MQKIKKTTPSNSKTLLNTFAFAIAFGGIMFSTATFANSDKEHGFKNVYLSYTSAIEGNSAGLTKTDDDDEIGSTFVMVVSANMGGYNRADGSMSGAYGDGEFEE